MKPILRIARTEILEHRRQPWMLFILGANYLLYGLVFGVFFVLVDRLQASPALLNDLKRQTAAVGVEFDTVLQLATSTWGSLSFTNLPLFVAILSGTSVLHDRECGTLPFLMLAPVTRAQLLVGKLLGAMAIPLAFHGVCLGASCLVFSQLPALAPWSYKFGGTAAWWVAFLIGAPASAAFVGALGTVISARSSDVRTSMQFTSFFIGLLSLGIGAVLVDGLTQGLLLQLAFAIGCLVAAIITLGIGARLLSRDVTG